MRIRQHHHGLSLKEELICGINGHGGEVGVGVVGLVDLIRLGTKHGGASRKKLGDENAVQILPMFSVTQSKSVSIDASGRPTLDGLQIYQDSSYHRCASLCNVLKEQTLSVTDHRATRMLWNNSQST